MFLVFTDISVKKTSWLSRHCSSTLLVLSVILSTIFILVRDNRFFYIMASSLLIADRESWSIVVAFFFGRIAHDRCIDGRLRVIVLPLFTSVTVRHLMFSVILPTNVVLKLPNYLYSYTLWRHMCWVAVTFDAVNILCTKVELSTFSLSSTGSIVRRSRIVVSNGTGRPIITSCYFNCYLTNRNIIMLLCLMGHRFMYNHVLLISIVD